MRTLTIQIPSTIKLDDHEAQMALAAKLYELGRLSLGQAADLAGLSKETFMTCLAEYGVSFFGYSAEELDEDVSNARSYSI